MADWVGKRVQVSDIILLSSFPYIPIHWLVERKKLDQFHAKYSRLLIGKMKQLTSCCAYIQQREKKIVTTRRKNSKLFTVLNMPKCYKNGNVSGFDLTFSQSLLLFCVFFFSLCCFSRSGTLSLQSFKRILLHK